MEALQESSGRDLSFFTGQWLQTAGVNTLSIDCAIDDGRFSRFTVGQTAPDLWPTLRRHRIAVGLYDETDDGIERVHRVEVDIDGAGTEVELVGVPAPAVVLLNDDDLSYAKIRVDRGLVSWSRSSTSSATWSPGPCVGGHLGHVPRRRTRPSDYVALVVRGVGVETDLTAVSACSARPRRPSAITFRQRNAASCRCGGPPGWSGC